MSQISSADPRTLSALFDSQSEANRAVDRLVDAGIHRDSVRIVPGNESDAAVENRAEQHQGFFAALSDFFFPDEDRYSYAEGLSRGGYLVVVDNLAASQHDVAVDILDDEGSIDLDQREESWRSEGWAGYSSESVSGYGSSSTRSSSLGQAGSATSSEATSRTLEEGSSESIPVVDERLVVGKRDVNLGRVRVRSYVREEPVSADINLHNENVTIERRSVDRPLGDADIAFTDRVIEAEEHAEEAVVGKEARVVEEISLRKEGTDRTETVSDTVRKTEVEIEDDRTAGSDHTRNRI
ncbi:YsnF/AvaK domain-containing protein [Devosia sediminis]|uniref:DUF2382 domain-containing protein n=1 Tax=Devosia sediminis TaxID=2798801 RepID=A0A934IVI7_9HYPH|nr:YsnF/AvaK domain-containing protein [Devosia sediminis]MBJ3783087.1 DUF2382 domain-containing protein [Devosia sediminis]